MIKYFGGKTWLAKKIDNYLPKTKVNKAIDLFMGGGSITDKLVTIFDNVVANDFDSNLINFYNVVKNDTEKFIEYTTNKLRDLDFEQIRLFRKNIQNTKDSIEKAYLYYCCVYSSYGGKTYQAPTRDNFKNLKKKNIEKSITKIKQTLDLCDITNRNYKEVIENGAFYYCDPPYCKVADNTYYGERGEAHKQFDHIEFFNFANEIAKNNKVMISYEDSEYIRELYKGWNIQKIDKKTVNYSPKEKCGKSLDTNELLIMNYTN